MFLLCVCIECSVRIPRFLSTRETFQSMLCSFRVIQAG